MSIEESLNKLDSVRMATENDSGAYGWANRAYLALERIKQDVDKMIQDAGHQPDAAQNSIPRNNRLANATPVYIEAMKELQNLGWVLWNDSWVYIPQLDSRRL